MRIGRGRHARLAVRLRAVNAGHPFLRQPATPVRIGKNHQLRHHLVDRAAALARHDVDAFAVELETVIDAVDRVGLAAPGFQHGGEVPQPDQFAAVGIIRAGGGAEGVGVELNFERLVAQVVGDVHHFHPGFGAEHAQVGRHVDVQRQRRAVVRLAQRVMVDQRLRQHGDLVAGVIHGRQPFARHPVEFRAGRDAERRRGDVDADADTAVAAPLHRQCVVDFGGRLVVHRERAHVAAREFRWIDGFGHRRKAGAARKVLQQEARQMEVERRRDRAAALDQPQLRQSRSRRRVFQRLVFQRVLVRRDEDAREQRDVFGRQPEGRQFRRQMRLPFRRQPLLLQPGLGRRQRLGRRRPVAATALLVEVDRRGVQLLQQRHRFRRPRRVAVILLRQLFEAEFVAARRLPQEVGVEFAAQRLGFAHHLGGAGAAKRNRMLAALILLRLPDAVSTCAVASVSDRMEPALKWPSSSKMRYMKNQKSRMVWKWRSNPAKPWLPPSSMICVAPA